MEYKWKTSVWKGLRPALVVALSALLVGLMSPEVGELIKTSPWAAAALPLILFVVEAARNAIKQTVITGQ